MMQTRRRWLMQVAGGTVLAGWSGVDLTAAELPAGVYEPSRDHLGHALAGHLIEQGGETELFGEHLFQQSFFHDPNKHEALGDIISIILGEPPEAAIVNEIARWIDLILIESAEVRAAARSLSTSHRTLALRYYGMEEVRNLEEFDAQKIVTEGINWLDTQSKNPHGFHSLSRSAQVALVKTISDDRHDPKSDNSGTRFFSYLKARVADGFYTSRAGLNELGYRGNAFYASPPGWEHLYG